MKIFGFEINKIQEVRNEVQNSPKPVQDFIPYKQHIYRIANDMATYKYGVLAAENYLFPTRYQLYQVYISTVLDPHLTAAWEQRKNLTLRKDFTIKNESGDIDEIKSELLEKKWFRDLVCYALDSKLWGHSLVQLGDYDKASKEFLKCELVPRQYVNPPKHCVIANFSDQSGLDYTQEPYSDWCVAFGEEWDLGLLMKAAPLVIWKKNAMGAWAEYQEGFGVPLRIGKTASTDPATLGNMKDFLSNFGVSKWGLFKPNDQIEVISSSNNDASKVFNDMVNMVNNELSKLILGQTSTMDEKAYSGSAEVHERVLDTYEEADEHFIMSELNYKLKPLLVKRGLMSETDYFGYEEEEGMDATEKIKIDAELLKYYTLSPEYIKEMYGTDVEVKEVTQMTDYKNKLNELYPD